MAIRLTKKMIDEISKTASQKIGESKLNALTTARDAIANKLYEQIVGEEMINKLNSLPTQFVASIALIKVGLIRPDSNEPLKSENGIDFHDRIFIDLGQFRRGPVNSYQVYYAIYETNELWLQYKEVDGLIEAHRLATNEARSKIYALLSSVRTVEKAIELWPEGKEYLEKHLDEPPMSLPAVAVNDVNAALTAIAA